MAVKRLIAGGPVCIMKRILCMRNDQPLTMDVAYIHAYKYNPTLSLGISVPIPSQHAMCMEKQPFVTTLRIYSILQNINADTDGKVQTPPICNLEVQIIIIIK